MISKLFHKFFFYSTNRNKRDFKDVLDGRSLTIPSALEPCCRIRFISLADVHIYSFDDFSNALRECGYWQENTLVSVASGKILEKFIRKILPRIKNKILVLVIDYPYVGTDSSVYNHYNILSNKNIKHLFAENWFGSHHPKLTILPIGIESPFADGSLYGNTTEKKFLELASIAKSPVDKPLKILVNAHLNIASTPASGSYNQRKEMQQSLHNNPLCDFWKRRETRERTWELHEKYAFELCPEGNGLDTHRFYEALWLNTIPIVKKNSLEVMYRSFPCVIVEHWEDITENLLKSHVENFSINKEKLMMGSYKHMIQSFKK